MPATAPAAGAAVQRAVSRQETSLGEDRGAHVEGQAEATVQRAIPHQKERATEAEEAAAQPCS